MRCAEILSALSAVPQCIEHETSTQILTHILYPSADPVYVFVSRTAHGFQVSDGGGALKSALNHARNVDAFMDRASKKYAVEVRGGTFFADMADANWLHAAIVAVSNASAMAARLAVESGLGKSENALKDLILDQIKSVVAPHKIGSDYEYTGRSGHSWKIDFVVKDTRLSLIKAVVQNGNSINSNYAAFGDIGEEEGLIKYCAYDRALNVDSNALLRQVAILAPVKTLSRTITRFPSAGEPNS